MPAEFGHQLFEDPPDWDSLIRGKCTLEEMQAIQSSPAPARVFAATPCAITNLMVFSYNARSI